MLVSLAKRAGIGAAVSTAWGSGFCATLWARNSKQIDRLGELDELSPGEDLGKFYDAEYDRSSSYLCMGLAVAAFVVPVFPLKVALAAGSGASLGNIKMIIKPEYLATAEQSQL